MTPTSSGERVEVLDLAQLKPYFSISILACVIEDTGRAFETLMKFLRKEAGERGRSIDVSVTGEIVVEGYDGGSIENVGSLSELGFDWLYGVTRRRTQTAPWAAKESGVTDIINELTLALSRGRLVAIRTDIVSSSVLLKWAAKLTTPYRQFPPEVLSGTFNGDGKMLWMQGVHRQRASKANTKALSGSRLQEAVDVLEDASYAMSAMKVNISPDDEDALLRGELTVSPDKSRVAFKAMSGLWMFLAATDETLGLLEKSLAAECPPESVFPELAIRETDLKNVFGAYDIRVASPEEISTLPQSDQGTLDRAELLRGALLDVEGDSRSPAAKVTVGAGGSSSGTLQLQPRAMKGGGFELDVRYAASPTDEIQTRVVRDALQDEDLVTIYYESGHTFTEGRIARQNLSARPFVNVRFLDFSGCNILREKPRGYGDQVIHDGIGASGDDSIFSWVAARFVEDWLICDDGPGEVADFLHLKEDGTLTAIHVKAAHSSSSRRGIAVTRFEELVSQAEKNVKLLAEEKLGAVLGKQRIENPACWRDGERVPSRVEFINQLRARIRSDKTYVMLIQPHLSKAAWEGARAASDRGAPTRDSYSLVLLDNLLHSTRRTVVNFWDDLSVIGCI